MSQSPVVAVGVITPDGSPVDFNSLTPSASAVAAGPGNIYYDTNATTRAYYSVSPNGQAFVAFGGGGGGTPSTTVPNALGTPAVGTSGAFMRADAVLPLPNALAVGAVPAALGTWDAVANIAYDANGVAIGALQSNTLPPAGAPVAYVVLADGTTTLNGLNNWLADDVAYQTNSAVWQKAPFNGPVPNTTAAIFGTGASRQPRAGVPGVDYVPGNLFYSTVPVANAPAGTMGNNGALVTSAAFGAAPGTIGYYDQGIWLDFAQGVINTSVGQPGYAAGKYFAKFTDTTHATIYNNVYVPGVGNGTPPVTPTAFSGTTGVGAYVTNTAELTMHSVAIPALGPRDRIVIDILHRNSTAGGSKTVQTKLNGNIIGYFFFSSGTTVTHEDGSTIRNMNSTARQLATSSRVTHGTSAAAQGRSVETNAGTTLLLTQSCGTSGDTGVIESFGVTIIPGV